MPVVVVGADTPVGEALVGALPGEVRALGLTSPVLHDGQRLAAALAGAHTLVHLGALADLEAALEGVDAPPRVIGLTPVADAPPPAFSSLEVRAHDEGFDLVVLRPGSNEGALVAAIVAADAARDPGARVTVLDVGRGTR